MSFDYWWNNVANHYIWRDMIDPETARIIFDAGWEALRDEQADEAEGENL